MGPGRGGKTVNIRPANPTDYAAFCQLYLEVNDLHAQAHPDLFQATDVAPFDEAEYCGLPKNPGQAIYLAFEGEEAVGFVNVILHEALSLEILAPRRFAVVDSLGVRAGFRRSGIGGELMACAEQWARLQGAGSIELNVFEFNHSALTFYQRLGYTDLSRKMRKKLD
jgi:GNAT superfamily N-acetyltransferase